MRISVNNGLFLSSAQADDKNSRSEFFVNPKNHHCDTPADSKEWSEICIETDCHCNAFNIKTGCNPE